MPRDTIRGRFVWHELMTTDARSAAGFYGRIVGWKTQAWPQDPSYAMFVAKGGPMAGLMVLPKSAKAMGAPPSWLTYVGTPDVDETSRLAVELGGSVLREPTDIPNVGRFSILQDPQGAAFATFTPVRGPMGDGKPKLGDFSWHELATIDWQAAFRYYQRLFGWEKTEALDMGPKMGTYQMFGWKGTTLGGMFDKPKSMPAPPHWLPYVMVQDSKKAAEAVRKLGGRILNGPMEVPGGDWVAQGMDLQGAVFAVHSKKPAVKKATAKKPAVKKPAVKKATAKKPVAKKASAKKAPVKKAAKSRTAKKRVTRKPVRRARSARKTAALRRSGATKKSRARMKRH